MRRNGYKICEKVLSDKDFKALIATNNIIYKYIFTYVSKRITVINLNLHNIAVTFIHQSLTNTI